MTLPAAATSAPAAAYLRRRTQPVPVAAQRVTTHPGKYRTIA
jgi:hypothetical protein